MAGIKVTKRYTSANLNNSVLNNNWMALVFGVTNEGPIEPTLVQNYETFLTLFGQPVVGVKTHNYVQFLINSGVNVLFKRIVDYSNQTKATLDVNSVGLHITATDAYIGEVGNQIEVAVERHDNIDSLVIYYKGQRVESYNLGIEVPGKSLLKQYCESITDKALDISKYVQISLTKRDVPDDVWQEEIIANTWKKSLMGGGAGNIASMEYALSILEAEDITKNAFWMDRKLKQAMTYYPTLRFVTTGGIIDDTDADGTFTKHEKLLRNLGQFAMNANSTFRVLVDYPFDTEEITKVVRTFAQTVAAEGNINPAVYAYFGDWGADGSGIWLPGSAGFLSALGMTGYNVYNRRIAGKNFNPAYYNVNNEIYLDELDDWQSEANIQLNPICVVDAQGNLAVMGSSTLAMPQTTSKNPEQALDVVLVGDYITALLDSIVLEALEVALDRLSLSSLSNTMTTTIDGFVTSGAITHYDLNLDTTVLGKLTVQVTLYFAVGLEEVQLIVSSVYDENAMTASLEME